MTESFVTQCPHCQTSFRVSYNQLSAARGAVRCGSCLQVFNAARQLLEKSTGQSAAALFGEALAPTARVAGAEPQASAPVLPDVPISAPAQPRGEPISQRRWAAAAEIDLDRLDLDDELARLEQRISPRSPPLQDTGRDDQLSARRDRHDAHHDDFADRALSEPPFGEHRHDTGDDPALHGQGALDLDAEHPVLRAERESTSDTYHYLPTGAHSAPPRVDDTLAMVTDEQVEGRALTQDTERAEPSLTHLQDELDDFDRQPTLAAVRDKRHRRSAVEAADESLRAVDAAPLKPAAKARRAEPRMRDEDLPDLSEDPLELQWQKSHSSWGKRLLWSLLALIAALTLTGQYVAYHFDELARQDAYRPWFEQLCPVVGCEVPSKVDIALIKSSNLVVRSHPQFNGALIVDAIIYNRAPFSQPFPLLELRFADLDGKLIASRRFKPSEYLSGDLAGQTDMPPQTPIHIALDILDPGTKAVNYSLSFQSPE